MAPIELPALSNGSHYITVHVNGTYFGENYSGPYNETSFDSQTVHFTVRSSIALLMEAIYNATEIPLDFIVDGADSQFAYSLDNQANVTIAGNTTLSGLTEGMHTIIVYTNDTVGDFNNFDTTTFTITKPLSTNPNPPPALLTACSMLLIFSVSLAALIIVLLFLKKRKRIAKRSYVT